MSPAYDVNSKPRVHESRAPGPFSTKFCTVVLNICAYSVWNFQDVTYPACVEFSEVSWGFGKFVHSCSKQFQNNLGYLSKVFQITIEKYRSTTENRNQQMSLQQFPEERHPISTAHMTLNTRI